ncbi:MAG TPA: hypothetical protein VKA70_19265 [Blastocatellia bacterium]|nr:hypothetical protein [Blastocatellia bacterium]
MFRRVTTQRRLRVATATLMFLFMFLMNSGLSLAFSRSPQAPQQAAPPQGVPPGALQDMPGGPPAADKPAPNVPEDASTLARYTLTQLRTQMQQSLASAAGMNVATRAHLQESLARIDETLKAQQQRVIS